MTEWTENLREGGVLEAFPWTAVKEQGVCDFWVHGEGLRLGFEVIWDLCNMPSTILNTAQLVTAREEITEGANSTSTPNGEQAGHMGLS